MATQKFCLQDADALLVVPPFADIIFPAIGVHTLQAVAAAKGIRVRILYGSLVLASQIGFETYRKLATETHPSLGLERLFGERAYGFSPLSEKTKKIFAIPELSEHGVNIDTMVDEWLDAMEEIIFSADFKVIGCSTSFEQTSSSVAILSRCKARKPELTTLLGGANCESELAEGILSLNAPIDYIFSGESEATFPHFLQNVLNGTPPTTQVIQGAPCMNLEMLPTPEYGEYFQQLWDAFEDESITQSAGISYETSRGCWWGQKHHCTFCGLNGGGMSFRHKTPERVLQDLTSFTEKYPVKNIRMVDNIMPHGYFQTLLPKLAEAFPEPLKIFYEQKANIPLKKAILLKNAGVTLIQPGVEAINTPLLKIMDKGIKAYQNIGLLRYSASLRIHLYWNLLTCFPGDRIEHYQDTYDLLPYLSHLQPPSGASTVSIDRFSPYFENPDTYSITNIRPKPEYYKVFPEGADIPKLAYHFEADFESEAKDNPELLQKIKDYLKQWWDRYTDPEQQNPLLAVTKIYDGQYMLMDTRGLPGSERVQFLDREQVSTILVGGQVGRLPNAEWAVEKNLLLKLDGRYVPLATASPDLLLEFEDESFEAAESQERLIV